GSYNPERTLAGWMNMEVEGPAGKKPLAALTTLSKFARRDISVAGATEKQVMLAQFSKPIVFPIEGLGYTRLRGRVALDDLGTASDVASSARFFVFSEQPDAHQMVAVTGEPPVPLPQLAGSSGELIDRLFWQTVARAPNDSEKQLAQKMLAGGRVSGLEDLLWSLLLHPEMQFLN
ncbi:MAG: hypothetical protein M3Y27_01570, partial [Acidobacteriota bacterium]|nr:hypothetical protein [Acidobacteriota bacterium]